MLSVLLNILSSHGCNQCYIGVSIRHSLRPYLEYVAYLYRRMDPLPEQERFEVATKLGPLNIAISFRFVHVCV